MMTNAEFRQLFDAVASWGRLGERGALHHLTAARVAAAADIVLSGITVTLSRPLDSQVRIDNPVPADHHMTMLTGEARSGSLRFAKDYVGADYHNEGHSHIDAFCHVAFDGRLYGGVPADTVTAARRGRGRDQPPRGRPGGPRRAARHPRAHGECTGSSPASTCFARTSRPRSAIRA